MIYDLVVQIFMAGSMVFGVTMIVTSFGFSHRLRRTELLARYVLGLLMLFSIYVRFKLQISGPESAEIRSIYSIIFDLFYMILTILFNINLMKRLNWNGRKEREEK